MLPTMPLTIGTCSSLPGQLTRGLLLAGSGANRQPVYLPLAMLTGPRSGPTIALSAGLHGDELHGIQTALRLLETLDPLTIKGRLLVLPVLNPTGHRLGRREVPEEGTDLNRAFPGQREGSLAEQIAFTVFESVLRRVDFGIDLHDAGRGNLLLPHARFHSQDRVGDATSTRELARYFGDEVLMERGGAAGMLAVEAQRLLNTPILTVELGGAASLYEPFIQKGLRGLRNLLSYLGMLTEEPVLPDLQYLLKERTGLPAPCGGVLTLHRELGETIRKGDLLAEVRDPFTGRLERVWATGTGILFSRRATARVEEGESVGSILEFVPCPVYGARPADGQVLDNGAEGLRTTRSRLVDTARQLVAPEYQRQAAE